MVVIKPWETPGTLKDLEGEGRAGGGGGGLICLC